MVWQMRYHDCAYANNRGVIIWRRLNNAIYVHLSRMIAIGIPVRQCIRIAWRIGSVTLMAHFFVYHVTTCVTKTARLINSVNLNITLQPVFIRAMP